MIELNKIHQGNSFEMLKQFADNSVDLVITDPPYGMSFQSNYRKVKHEKIKNDSELPLDAIKDCIRIAKKACYVFCRWDNLKDMPPPKSVLVWVKNNWSMGDLKHSHGRQWEAIWFYPKEQHEFIKRIPDVIHCNRTGNNLHPTEKPVELIRTLIEANKGETILDPFMGSGTTAIACKRANRNYIGIELESKYVEIANTRLSQYTLTADNFDALQQTQKDIEETICPHGKQEDELCEMCDFDDDSPIPPNAKASGILGGDL